jgi:hypothetical protein
LAVAQGFDFAEKVEGATCPTRAIDTISLRSVIAASVLDRRDGVEGFALSF